MAQGLDDSFVGGCCPGGDQCGAYRAVFGIKLLLQAVQLGQEGFEWAAVQRLVSGLAFAAGEGLQSVFLIHLFGLVGEQYGITVEGEADLVVVVGVGWAAQQGGSGYPFLQSPAYIFCDIGEEQVYAEGGDITVWAEASTEGCPGDAEFMVFNGVEYPEPGVGGVAGQQDDLHPARGIELLVDGEELSGQVEAVAGVQWCILLLDLVVPVGLQAAVLKDLMAFIQVKQSP